MSTLDFTHNLTPSIHIRSDAEPIDPGVVQLFVSEIETEQYFNVALATILIYHSVITMDKEVKHFWSKPCLRVSLIYFANRYVGLLGAICTIVGNGFKESLASCLFSDWIVPLSNWFTIVLIDYILLIRVLALYHQNRKLDICLKSLLSLEAATGLSILIYNGLFQGFAVGSLAEGVTICVIDREPEQSLTTISWVIPMAYGLILLSLALYKAAEYWRLSSGFKGFQLVGILVQDQVIYFGSVIFCSILQIVNDRVVGINQFIGNLLNVAGSPTLLCVLGGQLLINLKEAGERGVNGGTSYRMRSMSEIEFS